MNVACEVLRDGIGKTMMLRSLIFYTRRMGENGIEKVVVPQESLLKPAFLYVYGMRELFGELVAEQQSPHLPYGQYLYGQYQQQEYSTGSLLHRYGE